CPNRCPLPPKRAPSWPACALTASSASWRSRARAWSPSRTSSRWRAQGHKVILVLSDHHGYCGDGGVVKTQAFYEGEFRKQLLPWVRTLAARLKDSPGVAMWELVKEPVGIEAQALRGFFDAV